MGVNSLWEVLGPTARTVRLEALTRRKLAVDASIWIYQFLKAVRDSEGNTLHQSHIVGFFRRICKLLYFGILPIFVFDGGAPALKRETIQKRRERREGKRESATETAQRLLAIHVQREANKQQDVNNEELIYLDDLSMNHPQHVTNKSPRGKQQPKRFIPKDEYHLPELKKIKVHEHDERLMPEDEFNELAGESFDIVDGIDINEIDPKSEEFANLPMSTQYMILSHLRLKSRLRLGFSKEQLKDIFNDSMDFSKFQIQQVQKRNFFTQRLMDVSGMGDEGNATRRIAGEKDRKYALLRTNDGWSLSLGQGNEEHPIEIEDQKDGLYHNVDLKSEPQKFVTPQRQTKVENVQKEIQNEHNSDSESDDFEDVPLENDKAVEEISPEDEEFQKALVASIYDQYSDKKEHTVDDGFSSTELQHAIDESKKDLFDLEKQLLKGSGATENEVDLSQSLLFTSVVKPKPERKDKKIVIESENDEFNNTPVVIDDDVAPTDKEKNIVDIEAIVDSDKDEEDTKQKNDIPEWFNEKLDDQLFNYKTPESNFRTEIAEEDEEAGLISWNDAKSILDREPHQDSESDDSLEVIEPIDNKPQTKPDANTTIKPIIKVSEDVASDARQLDVRVSGMSTKETEPSQITSEGQADKADENISKAEENISKPRQEFLDYEFIDDDEKAINKSLASEYQDYEDLRNQIKISQSIPLNSNTSITEEQLLQERLHKQRRDAEEVTVTMINDVQELLRRFGIPFITAPMEAEAQCAELLKIGLVDGIITDDSDCFLFGGDRIYKNMFNQKQYVECYMNSELQGNLGLDQTKLIELGLLLGSDYTEGIKGIGPVLAMEILADFGSLKQFKLWYDECTVGSANATTTLRKNLISRIKNGKLFLPSSFPDDIVFDAYIHPEVDSSDEPIKWGIPDLDQIRSFLMYNVGWSQSRVDEVMVPLIRDMNKKLREGTQSTINEFFPVSHNEIRREIKVGKRLKAAATKLNRSK